MKATKLTIILSVLVLALTTTTYAIDSNDDIWEDDSGRMGRGRQREMTPEKVEQILERIEQKDPEKAEQLRKLQEDDPQAFENELRQMGRKMRSKRQRDGQGQGEGFRSRKHRGNGEGQGLGEGKGGRKSRKGRSGRRGMREHKEEFEQWLQENYPEKAIELEKLETEDPDTYRQQLMTTMRKYGRLFRAEKNNPELAETLKADIQAKEEIKTITQKIKTATTEDEKEALAAELETAVANRFDLIIKRKQQQVAQMQKKLEELQKKVIDKQVAIKELQAKKQAEVKARVDSLIKSEEKVDWD